LLGNVIEVVLKVKEAEKESHHRSKNEMKVFLLVVVLDQL